MTISEDTASQSRRTSPLMVIPVHCLVVLLPCATGDDGQPMRLLPRGRLTTAILPIVGRATGATSGGDNLGGGVVSERFIERHGQTVSRTNKSAMPKITLAICRHSRHITRMSNTNQLTTPAHLSLFADKMLVALKRLTSECEAHPCGGFTTDDMQWRMGLAFTPEETLWAALDELTEARLIRYCGDDDKDAIGTCYEILHNTRITHR